MSTTLRTRSKALAVAVAAAAALAVATVTAVANPSPALAQGEALPDSFQWESTGPLVAPQQTAPGRTLVSIKDPSVVQYQGEYHVYATTADTGGGWSLTYFGGFTDWSQAASAPQTHLSTTAIGGGYRAAPQVFYFEPRDEWYLVYQTGLPSFSLLDDPGSPQSATAPQNFMNSHGIADANSSYIVDYWVICDDVNCYLFFNNDKHEFYRARTTVAEFPNGFGDVELYMQSSSQDLFEATNVYKVGDTGQYMLIVEAIGSDGRRYFRSWTSDRLDANFGEWTPLADTESNPFARSNNVSFPGGAWTRDISHGEMVRDQVDQTMTIDPCDMQYLYQGMNPNSSGEYSQLPWRLGLLTHTNPACESDGDPTDPPDDETTDPPDTGECTAAIEVVNDWGSGWQGNVTVTAGGSALDGWSLTWDWPGGQSIDSAWNADWSQSGSMVSAADVGWNGSVAAGQSREVFGFVASGTGAEPQVTCSSA
ncbi:non-reducing end alpha-L-arabinofuranosidase family hydrolase [Glycomyces arizonensis]|uniref:non-reducing end alpha-L-arabinofuranosidase family hydrolase n=1 Tax=Glycomyces arizonensis TaxID=256035 RepID=UPI0009FBDC85|nr:non-reducing end alpha-L-arabinofuranosidase family hydrolase [Glycomyces arizonensis]